MISCYIRFSKPGRMLSNCNAYDLILVKDGDKITCSHTLFYFGCFDIPENHSVTLVTAGLRIPVANNAVLQGNETLDSHCPDVLRDLAACLQPGRNKAHFVLSFGEDITGIANLNIFLWDVKQVVVVDLDGTITKSTMPGFWKTAVLRDFDGSSCHDGVCEFLSKHDSNIVYLTNRPITFATITRDFITQLNQDGYALPPGPLIGFNGGLAGVVQVRKQDDYVVPSHTLLRWTLSTRTLTNSSTRRFENTCCRCTGGTCCTRGLVTHLMTFMPTTELAFNVSISLTSRRKSITSPTVRASIIPRNT